MAKAKTQSASHIPNAFDGDFDPSKIKVVRDLTTDFKWEEGKNYYFTFLGKMEVRAEHENTGKGKGKSKRTMEPPTVAKVRNLQNNKEFELIISSVPKARLEEAYPNGEYVGKSFHMIKHPKAEGKRYNRFTVEEITIGE